MNLGLKNFLEGRKFGDHRQFVKNSILATVELSEKDVFGAGKSRRFC
jgi:hypothetical protein